MNTKLNPTTEQLLMLCNGETVEIDGKKVFLTVVEPKLITDYDHLINKWVRYNVKGRELCPEYNHWCKIKQIKLAPQDYPTSKIVFIIEQNPKFDYKEYGDCCFDLNNPLDYNPKELIGKYYQHYKIEGVGENKITGVSHFHLGGDNYIACKDLNPSEVTDTPPSKSLKYEDIVGEVKPLFYSASDGKIYSVTDYIKGCCENTVATQRDAKKLRATAQLLVVMHAANGGEWIPKDGEERVVIEFQQKVNAYYFSMYEHTLHQLYFRTREDAEKALADNKQLFNEYFGIDE